MRPTSSSSAGATYLNKEERIAGLRAAARRAAVLIPALRRVVLFGSLARGIPTPRSDADLLIVVEASPYPEPRDRVPDLLRAMRPLPCPLDLFVLTAAEMEMRQREGDPLLREALAGGLDLL
jgi:predicted nucleotidyltransferase